MNALTAARETLADVLKGAGFAAHAHFPDRLTPPCAIVQGGEPYLDSEEQPFGCLTIRHEVIVVERKAANQSAADRLDSMISGAVTALIEGGYSVERISQPYGLDVGTAVYPAASVTTTSSIRI